MQKKILVVDNHPAMLKWITNLFEKEGHEVLTAVDGLSALDMLKTYRPDVLFVDLIMPNIGGEKFCQVVRKELKLEDIFIVVFSGIAAEEDLNFAEFGANACIAKGPFDKLGQHVLRVLDEVDGGRSISLFQHTIGREGVYPRQITKELLSFKKHFETILRSMSEGILEITPEGRIVYANPKAVSLIGVPEERLLATDLTNLFHSDDQERMKGLLSTLNTHRKTVNGDPPLRLNGKQVSLNLLPILDDEHRTNVLLINDVSEKKRMEAKLLQAQKMEAIATLAGGIAHDFNNLLMVIQGNTSLMLFDIGPEHPHFERLKGIEKQVQQGSRLTGQLLGYARKGRYEMKPINLNRLVKETAEMFGRTRKEVTIHQELAEDLSTTEADQGQMGQVLMNLFINAADAMPGRGNLNLKTANTTHENIMNKVYHPEPGPYVLLTVSDTGIGMDRKTMERIFDPFFTTKELGRGTGLGLASVYGIIKGHGGYIDVESEIGKGTTFRIYLRASEKEARETVKSTVRILAGTETILLIDDEEMIVETGERLLRAMGYRPLVVQSGKEAIEIYKEKRETIALVLLDMVMPEMGGGEVFDRLKEINPDVKVLLSSGYSIDGEATKILSRGCNGFIQKPFDMAQLSQSIRTILD